MKYSLVSVALFTLLTTGVQAQNIERIKMTDNDLNCQQIYGEIGQMDGVIALASQPVPAPLAQPDATAGVAGAVAQTAIAGAMARSAGSFGGFGNFGGGLGNMFGGIAQQMVQGATAQQAASSGAAQQQATAGQQNQALQSQQAQGRKEHLTGMFLSKGCKMSDIKR
ncbi:MAG: hypothetical protein H7228_01310 [Polaromonas sp.]|nr:hypothetical protein [Polaromonas sp.]